ncbi:MAG: ABC transporter permease subunit [Isosphaeraceae bacterium]
MGLRLGPGPVFVYEWLTATRRRQLYVMRALFVGMILAGMILAHRRPEGDPDGRVSLQELASYGEQLYQSTVIIELMLILLAAPAATAGAVCLDRARGTLDHMLATDLSNAEIVLGKLGVRLIPVLGLIASIFPVVALSTLLGGIDPVALAGSFLVAIGCAVLGCSLALTLSVFGRKPHEVLVLTYMILVAWLLSPILVGIGYEVVVGPPQPAGVAGNLWTFLHDAAEWSNPFLLAMAPYRTPGMVGIETYAGFLAGCLLVSAALTGLAMARVRGVALNRVGRPARQRRFRLGRPSWLPRLPGPSLDDNPVAWREWHRSRPTLMMRAAWGLYAALGLFWLWVVWMPPFHNFTGKVAAANTVQVTIGLFLLSVGAATSLAEERVRGSLDVLLSTPMSTRSILAGKWWGSYRRILSVAIWPAVLSIALLLDGGSWVAYLALLGLVLAHGAAITSLGLALATWVSRIGRAIALCVTIHLAWIVVWPFVVAFFLQPNTMGVAMVIGDAPFGVFGGTVAVSREDSVLYSSDRASVLPMMVVWIIVIWGFARVLFLWAVGSFDDCLGRIPEAADWSTPDRSPRRSRPMPAAGPSPHVRSSAEPE